MFSMAKFSLPLSALQCTYLSCFFSIDVNIGPFSEAQFPPSTYYSKRYLLFRFANEYAFEMDECGQKYQQQQQQRPKSFVIFRSFFFLSYFIAIWKEAKPQIESGEC